MTSVSMAELRKRLAHYLDRVEQGERIRIRRRGRVVAMLEPSTASFETADQRLKALKKLARIGDVTSPIDTSWDADHGSA
jgi:prevent-host-death family protein